MKYFLILFIVSNIFAVGGELKELKQRSERGVEKAKNIKGFIVQQQQIIPNIAEPEPVPPPAEPEPERVERPSSTACISQREYDKDYQRNEDRFKEMQENMETVTQIMENMQSQNESHTKNMNFLMKIIEVIIAIFAGISGLVGVLAAIRPTLLGWYALGIRTIKK